MEANDSTTAPVPQKQFRVLVATAGLELGDMIAPVLSQMLPGFAVKVTSSSADSLAVLLADPELKSSHLVIVLINNLRTAHAPMTEAHTERLAFIHFLRSSTTGVILITSTIWSDELQAAYLHAGADFAERLPFTIPRIEQLVARALALA